MPTADTNRRLRSAYLEQDIESLRGLSTVTHYLASRTEATPEALQSAYNDMIAAQSEEIEAMVHAKAATDKARLAEWVFHDRVLAMKESVRGQFGSDSNEAQAIGYKKKSERKRPRRTAA